MALGKVDLLMHFLFGTIAKEIPGPELTVDCLWCGQRSPAHSRKRTEWLMLFHLIPLFPFRTVFVKCDSCHQDMVAKCSLEDLSNSNPVTLMYLLVKRISLIGKICIILGLLLFWVPLVGLLAAFIGFIYGKKYGGWMKTAGALGLILSSLMTLLGIIGALFFK